MKNTDYVRDFWNQRPCNIRHSNAPVGGREYFDQVEARRYFVEPHNPAFAQFGRWKGKKVLEIGCGIGTDSVNFARAGAYLTAVDISDKSIDLARRRFAVYGLHAEFYQGNAEELSSFVPIQQYDLIYSFGVIHHTPNPEKIIKELEKYCGPQTELRLMVYSKWSWKVLWIILKYGQGAFQKADELVRMYSEAQTGCPYTYTYTFRGVRRLLQNFKIVKISKDHVFPYVIDRYIRHEYVWEWYFAWMPGWLWRLFKRAAGWHILIEAKFFPSAKSSFAEGALN